MGSIMGHSQNLPYFEKCCPQMKLENSNGFCVCSNCGIVHNKHYISTEEVEYLDDKEKKKKHHEIVGARCGVNRTVFSYNWQFSTMKRLFRLNRSLWCNGREKSITFIKAFISNIVSIEEFQKLLEKSAIELFLRIKKDWRNNALEHVAMGMLYIASLQINNRVDIEALSNKYSLNFKKIKKVIRILKLDLGIQTPKKKIEDYVQNIINSVSITQEEIELVNRIIEKTKPFFKFRGETPNTIIGASIYIAKRLIKKRGYGIKLSQNVIASACNITAVTLRQKANLIASYLRIEI